MSLEEEETLRLLGVEDPRVDEIPDEVLDSLEASAEAAADEWERDFFNSLLTRLEAECV